MSTPERPTPFRLRPWRVLLAFLVAPYAARVLPFVVAALTPVGVSPMPRFKPNLEDLLFGPPVVALFGAYPITVILGVPLFFVLYGRVGFGPIPPILGGLAIVVVGVTAMLASTTTVDWDGGVHREDGSVRGLRRVGVLGRRRLARPAPSATLSRCRSRTGRQVFHRRLDHFVK